MPNVPGRRTMGVFTRFLLRKSALEGINVFYTVIKVFRVKGIKLPIKHSEEYYTGP